MPTNRHHLWWPRKEYETSLARKFRNLPCNVVEIDVNVHKEIHAHQKPPLKPSHTRMQEQVDSHKARVCGCYT